MAADITGLQIGSLPDGDVSYMPLTLVPIDQAEETREVNAEAEESQDAEDEDIENSIDDDRQEEEAKALQVKKNGHPHRNGRSGSRATALVGVGNASSRLAHKLRSRGTNEK